MNAVEQLREAIDEFRRFLEKLPEADLVEKAWGPKEVLAHLVFWIESYVIQIEAILAGEPPEPPRGRFEDLNARVVTASRGVSVEELLCRHQVACKRLCDFAQTHDPESIIFVLKHGSSRRRPLTWYLTAEADHIRVHQQLLERQARREYLNEVENLRETVEAFCQFIQELPEATLVERAGGPKEVLAHLVIGHELCLAQIEAILVKETFELPRGEALNSQVVETARDVSVDELLRRFQVANERLCRFGQALDPQNMVLELWRLQMKRGFYLTTLDDFITKLKRHIRSQHRKLARASESKV